MDLSGKEFGYLRYIERWATYKASEGALSLEQVIRKDKKGYFPSIMREDEKFVKSFSMGNIPQADGMLVFGYPRVLAYAAEIAVRHRDKYGDFPELFSVGDGRGMFAQRQQMDKWFPKMLVELGFPGKWAFKNSQSHVAKNRDYVKDAKVLVERRLVKGKRFKLLVVTNVGCSLSAAQELSDAMPYADVLIFECPQPANRYFDSEFFSVRSYGVDVLLAQFIRCRMNSKSLSLPVEKLLEIPRLGFIQNLLKAGYAGCVSSAEMWKYVGLNPEFGAELNKMRVAQLQRFVRPNRFDKQVSKLLDEIRARFVKKGLVI